MLEGAVIDTCYPLHRNEEFLKSLRKVIRKPLGNWISNAGVMSEQEAREMFALAKNLRNEVKKAQE